MVPSKTGASVDTKRPDRYNADKATTKTYRPSACDISPCIVGYHEVINHLAGLMRRFEYLWTVCEDDDVFGMSRCRHSDHSQHILSQLLLIFYSKVDQSRQAKWPVERSRGGIGGIYSVFNIHIFNKRGAAGGNPPEYTFSPQTLWDLWFVWPLSFKNLRSSFVVGLQSKIHLGKKIGLALLTYSYNRPIFYFWTLPPLDMYGQRIRYPFYYSTLLFISFGPNNIDLLYSKTVWMFSDCFHGRWSLVPVFIEYRAQGHF